MKKISKAIHSQEILMVLQYQLTYKVKQLEISVKIIIIDLNYILMNFD